MFTEIQGGVCAPKGFKAGGVHCGIRKNKTKKDLALILSEAECSTAATYTTNKVKGAPLVVSKENLKNGKSRAVICNSGNANTCCPNGEWLAKEVCRLTGEALSIDPTDVIVSSTGVIGQEMEIEPFEKGIPEVVAALKENGSEDAAEGIMTTDTIKKEIAIEFSIGGKVCRIGAIAKGSGMINPNMATMLCFITSDVNITPKMLQKALSDVVSATFNQVSVDGDTSTNDSVFVMANGLSENKLIESENGDYAAFCSALLKVCTQMSRLIAKDGEGATKLIECTVCGAPDLKTARKVSKSVISSSLFKAAMFGADANWGRILCAIGYTEGDFDISKTEVAISSQYGEITVCKDAKHNPYSEDEAAEILKADEITIFADLKQGNSKATAWGCDLTYDYVKINGDYRT